MVLTALAIWLEDNKSPIFRQQRVGRDGHIFVINKFRSMPVNTKNVVSADVDDIQVTRIGKFIRRTNLDELPQLVNILVGDMSIVGPRPALMAQTDLNQLRKQYDVYRLAPGLTGLAQVRSYDGMSEIEKAKWDSIYNKSISLWTDLKIMIATFSYILKPPPVY